MRQPFALAMLVGLLLAACEDGASSGPSLDAGLEDDGGAGGLCRADANDDAETAETVSPGVAVQEFICTPRDADWYRFEVTADAPLARLRLTNDAPFSPVTYEVSLVDSAGVTLERVVDPEAGRKPVLVEVVVRLDEPGTYYAVVRDTGGLSTDPNAPYSLVVELLPDPDGHEPNDGPDQARPLDDCEDAHLAFVGDQDWWAFELPAGDLLHAQLTVDEESTVTPRYEVFPAGGDEPLVGGEESAHHALPGGTYHVRVRDLLGRADLEAGYRLCLGAVPEPDPHDKPERNDRPGPQRESLGEERAVAGGLIASLGDRDWFRVEAREGTDAAHPSLYEVELALSGPSTEGMQMAFSLIRPHRPTPCAVDTDCGTLKRGCVRGTDCPGFVCNPAKRECAGAGVCLEHEGVCGVTIYTSALRGVDVQATRLSTRQPLFEGGEYHLVIHDFQDDDYDQTVEYALTWRTFDEPDRHEPNGFYAPYPGSHPGGGAGSDKSRRLAATASEDLEGRGVVEVACAEGYVSYPGDEDWFSFGLPEEVDTPSRTWHFEFTYTDSGSDMALEYLVFAGNPGALHLGWFEGGEHVLLGGPIPGNGVWGATECAYACHLSPRPFWMKVSEVDGTGWDDLRPYRVCLRATEGCRPELCPCGPPLSACPEPGEGEGEGEGEGGGP